MFRGAIHLHKHNSRESRADRATPSPHSHTRSLCRGTTSQSKCEEGSYLPADVQKNSHPTYAPHKG